VSQQNLWIPFMFVGPRGDCSYHSPLNSASVLFTAIMSHPLWRQGPIVCSLPVHSHICNVTYIQTSRDTVVGIANGYGLDGRRIGVRVLVRSRIFTSCPYRLWGPPNLLSNGYQGPFPEVKAAGAWSWPLTSNLWRGQANVDLYIHFSICLHGVVLN
jgi:hypothetical protein